MLDLVHRRTGTTTESDLFAFRSPMAHSHGSRLYNCHTCHLIRWLQREVTESEKCEKQVGVGKEEPAARCCRENFESIDAPKLASESKVSQPRLEE
ncbi:unnamed protein product [Cylicostephanus goldi]|uniref:Uncharacterized protein n=1 Tax=Cylicostephanus goldi TaxID=71465 RepID=A0A3P7NBM1_CYLGO|nr:unnamed protein product [Cylicostephanus goldi]